MLTGLNCLDKRCDLRMPITVDILQKILQSLPVGELVSHPNKEVKHALQVGNIRFVSTLNALDTTVWIVGSSIISRSQTRARQSSANNLDLSRCNISILWQGKLRMRLGSAKINHLNTFIEPPSYLILHCSGNAIGQFSKSIALIHRILKTIRTLFTILPYKKIVWSQIVPRLSWTGEINHASANKVRLRINRIISKYVICNGGFYVRYPELIEKNVSLFDQGGVHLTSLENDLFL
ncbi:LOW QUALITY PROTEIN: hypothetical protein KUTeg_016435 [Tegillarca granosa]|uniref:Uncharacterized protein n=1 Tax=Tegillarca granosa TaxID=220873 RepID=A0ABQ9EQP7_TEGGR|nr:LOW QUALITY PROTEIN: hypothetical protein KUTeg_016435 [Tegillarca granosa]